MTNPATHPAPPDVRAALRRATSHLHEQVDAAMPLSRAAPGLADYRAHLQLLAPWVESLATLGVERSRLQAEAQAIDADIRECARLLGTDAPATRRMAASPVRSAGAAFGLGARYVLEGSRLGATFLHRRLADALAPHPLAYLSGAGWAREGAWRDFLAQLQRQVVSGEDIDQACEGADAAFRLLLEHCSAA